MPTKKSAPSAIHQIKVTLLGSKPPIWRRLQVPGNASLGKLNQIIQTAMGWTNSHLHDFSIRDQSYSDPGFELEDTLNEKQTTLTDLKLAVKEHFRFNYDMGDYWQHEVLIEKILEPDPEASTYAVCITGKRACPPEDCGGIYGYDELIDALQNEDHPEHESMLEWIGDGFDPEAFDLDAINRQLKKLK